MSAVMPCPCVRYEIKIKNREEVFTLPRYVGVSPVSTHRQCYSEVFTSSTAPEYQYCLTTCLRAEGLDVHPQVNYR